MKIAGSAAVLAAALMITPSTPAYADDPAAGSDCDSGQLNLTTKSSAGEGLRCLAQAGRGYVWQHNDGSTQTPEDAAGIAKDSCHQLSRKYRKDCEAILNGG